MSNLADFEVDYSYFSPVEGVLVVQATDIDDAEIVALDKLSEILPPEVTEMQIDSIREITK